MKNLRLGLESIILLFYGLGTTYKNNTIGIMVFFYGFQ
jgi:hypothetical protein